MAPLSRTAADKGQLSMAVFVPGCVGPHMLTTASGDFGFD